MKTLSITGNGQIPTINFDFNKGNLEIKGRSIPENIEEFYRPVINALNDYLKAPKPLTTLNVQLEYYNSSSSLAILEIFKRLEVAEQKNNKIVINWLYEDEEMLESGENFREIVKIPINLLSVAK